MRSRLELVAQLRHRLVADAQLVLVDVGVVDAVDGLLAQPLVVDERRADVVAEAEAFEEVLVDDVRAGRDDGVDHVVLDHLQQHLLQAGADQRPGEAQDDAALGVVQHALVDLRGARRVACLERHLLHGVDERNRVEGVEAEVLDLLLQQVFLVHGDRST